MIGVELGDRDLLLSNLLEGREVVGEETLIRDMGRIRDVRQAPDGTIYLAMDGDARGFDGDPTPILRLVPAGTR